MPARRIIGGYKVPFDSALIAAKPGPRTDSRSRFSKKRIKLNNNAQIGDGRSSQTVASPTTAAAKMIFSHMRNSLELIC